MIHWLRVISLALLLVPFAYAQTESTTGEVESIENVEQVAKPEPVESSTPVLFPYTANYDIFDGRKSVGVAQRSLKREGEHWRMEMTTGIDRWYYKYHYVESSLFKLNNGLPLPLHYLSDTERSYKKDRTIESSFDWKNKKETGRQNGTQWTLPLNNHVFDHLNYQLALQIKAPESNRQELLRVSYKGEFDTYKFVNEGKETINTPLGKFETVVWSEKINDPKGKYMVLWLAPELNYIPVQITRYNKGKVEGTIKIKSIEMEK